MTEENYNSYYNPNDGIYTREYSLQDKVNGYAAIGREDMRNHMPINQRYNNYSEGRYNYSDDKYNLDLKRPYCDDKRINKIGRAHV